MGNKSHSNSRNRHQNEPNGKGRDGVPITKIGLVIKTLYGEGP